MTPLPLYRMRNVSIIIARMSFDHLLLFVILGASVCRASERATMHARYDTFLRLVRAVTDRDKPGVKDLLRTGVNPNIHIQYGTGGDRIAIACHYASYF